MSNAVATTPAPSEPIQGEVIVGKTLTNKEEAFAIAVVETGNMSLAYRRAYEVGLMTRPNTIWHNAQDIANRPHVAARIRAIQEAAAAQVVFSKQRLAEFFWRRITADRGQLINHRRTCCRYCHGTGNMYQWKDEVEYAAAAVGAVARGEAVPECDGGFGFDPHRHPNRECAHTNCLGDGIGKTVIQDTMTLAGDAALIYEGVKETAQGIEVKVADRNADAAILMKLLGWSTSDLEGALRGAAAGGAAGALAASAVVEKVKAMDSEDTRRAYLTFTTGG
jgi:phage terminase small subunit